MLDFIILKRSNIIFLCVLPSLGFSFFVQRPLYCLLGHVTMFHWELYIHFLQCLLLEGNAKLNRFPKGSFGQSFWAFKTTFLKDGETKHLWWGRQRTLIRVKFQQPHLPIYQQPCYNWRYHFFHPYRQAAVICLLVHVDARPRWQRSTPTTISLQSIQILEEECQAGNLLQIHIAGSRTQAKCDGTSTKSSTTSKSQQQYSLSFLSAESLKIMQFCVYNFSGEIEDVDRWVRLAAILFSWFKRLLGRVQNTLLY